MSIRKKILVIEDDIQVRETISEIVNNAGYSAVAKPDGQAAIEFLEDEIPDLIISDIMMPKVDGFEVLEYVRSAKSTATIPFIFISAKSDYTDIRSGMINGAEDYLTKPFRAKDLIQAINAQLKKKEKIDTKFENLCNNISTYIPHELTTPIVSIIGYPELMMEDFKSLNEKEILFMLSQIKQSGIQLNKTIGKFIKYADIQSRLGSTNKNVCHNIIPTQVVATINVICQKLTECTLRKSDLVIKSIEAVVHIELEDLEFIIEELLTNAFKFSEKGTQILFEGKVENNNYQIEVTDHGRGMTNQQIMEFIPFNQHDRKLYEQQGLGLGLITIKKIAEYYNGNFQINSQIGSYTKCTVTLPLAKK